MKYGISFLSLALTLMIAVLPTHAAENDPASIAKRIAPLASANLVIRFDIGAIDGEQLGEAITSRMFAGAQKPEMKQRIAQLVDQLQAQEIEELFVALRILDVPTPGPIFVVPGVTDASVSKVRAALTKAFPNAKMKMTVSWPEGPALLLGQEDALNSLAGWESVSTGAQKQLVAGFKSIQKHPIQLIGRLSQDDQRVVREILHVLPEEVGGGPVGNLVDGVQWLAIGASLPPKASASAVLQCEDGESAERCKTQVAKMLMKLAASPEAKKAWPNIDQMLVAVKPNVNDDRLELRWTEGSPKLNSLLSAFTQPLERARAAQRRTQAFNDLKHIALAMHNHYDTYRKFPDVASRDENGRKLLSWRVHLLPFLEQAKLYEQFRLDEPWDSEHNKKLIPKMPQVFLTPGSKLKVSQGRSTYRVPSTESSVFPPNAKSKEFRDIRDGTSNTAMVMETDDDHAVVWTKPEGLAIDAKRPHAGLGGHFDDVILMALCDGSARAVRTSISVEMLNALIGAADGKVLKLP